MFFKQRLSALILLSACFSFAFLPQPVSAERFADGLKIHRINAGLPPGTCPPGFRPSTPPLNPALGCIPDSFYLPTGRDGTLNIPEGMCPQGWRPVTPPLNPMLVCLPDQIVAESFDDGRRIRVLFSGCPNGWAPVTKRRSKSALICLPKRIIASLPAVLPPGQCPEGWRPVTPPLNPVLGCLPDTIIAP